MLFPCVSIDVTGESSLARVERGRVLCRSSDCFTAAASSVVPSLNLSPVRSLIVTVLLVRGELRHRRRELRNDVQLRVDVVELLAHVHEDHAADECARQRRIERVGILGKADREGAAVLQGRRAGGGGGGDGRERHGADRQCEERATRAEAVIAFPLLWMRFPLDVLRAGPGFPGRCEKARAYQMDPTRWELDTRAAMVAAAMADRVRHRPRRPPRGDDPGAGALRRVRLGVAAAPGVAGDRVRRVADAGAGGAAQAPGLGDRAGRAEPRRDGPGSERARGARGLRGARRARGPRSSARVDSLPRRRPSPSSRRAGALRGVLAASPRLEAGQGGRQRRRRVLTPTGSAATTCSISSSRTRRPTSGSGRRSPTCTGASPAT